MKVYAVMYKYHWSYEDHGTEIIACFKDLYHAELMAHELNGHRDARYSVDEEFGVEEIQIV